MAHLLLPVIMMISLQSSEKISSTVELIQAMQNRYKGKWYPSLTFIQETTRYDKSEPEKTIWYEAISFPKLFRIDFGNIDEGNAVIFANDSVYQFKSGVLKSTRLRKNELLLLSGGILFMPLHEAMQELIDVGYDVNAFHEAEWEGKAVYVVGAQKGNLSQIQFWIDQKDLLLVRTLNQTSEGKMIEARFKKYIQTRQGGFVETEVEFFRDGKLDQTELYTNINTEAELDPRVFDATQFGKVHWYK